MSFPLRSPTREKYELTSALNCWGRRKPLIAFVAIALIIPLYSFADKKMSAKNESQVGDASAVDRIKADAASCVGENYELTQQSRVLVTGAAGFIGNSVSGALQPRVQKVVGLDNYNDYYSPDLKEARTSKLLRQHGVPVVRGDVCNATLLNDLFAKHRFTHVIHLAAQAGVRYSLKHPLSYVRNNLECFVTLLEAIRSVPAGYPQPHLTYASSSSVYGLNRKMPFSESDPVEQPANLYGATKRANEQIAFSYAHLFGLRSVGLRFFTVYGPWGRPDMAAFLFTRAIERGETITLYNGGHMRRDFTYIDDIVAGIIASAQFCSREPAVFNLGNNKPVEVTHFVHVIEKELGKKATIVYKNSTAEIKTTYADITKAQHLLNFVPRTSIEKGMAAFIQWYQNEPRRDTFAGGAHLERRRLL